jgi:predicted ArsR family transcriptional regulator
LSSKFSKKIEIFFNFFCILSDMRNMEGMTVSEIAKELKISVDAVRKRIETAGIQPITREALYDPSVVEELRRVRMGRPKKPAEPEDGLPKQP